MPSNNVNVFGECTAGQVAIGQGAIPAGSSIRTTIVRAGGSSQCRVNLVCIKVL